jgi:hypothetical protein
LLPSFGDEDEICFVVEEDATFFVVDEDEPSPALPSVLGLPHHFLVFGVSLLSFL